MNNNLLLQAQKWLGELGIKSEAAQTFLKVSRDDVVNFYGNEVTAYAEILKELKIAVSVKLHWDGRDDDYMYLNSF